MKILVTGAAGFIGFHFARRLLDAGHDVVGLDNLNHYYDVNLKLARLRQLGIDPTMVAAKRLVRSTAHERYFFIEMDLQDGLGLRQLFAEQKFDHVVNLAAQAGVRYSLENPQAYIDSNVLGFSNLLECCRYFPVRHLVFASSSSVYGLNQQVPFRTSDHTDHPVSLYAATKKSNELMAHTYSHLFGIPTTGLRFFTVYGAWGRPDMATMLFAKAITQGKTIKVFNHGEMSRDFTYVGDIVEGMIRVLDRPPQADSAFDATQPDPGTSSVPYRVYNIGKGQPVRLLDFILTLEELFGRTTKKEYMEMQPGDVQHTYADVSGLERDFGYQPDTDLRKGLGHFVEWYRQYYHIDQTAKTIRASQGVRS